MMMMMMLILMRLIAVICRSAGSGERDGVFLQDGAVAFRVRVSGRGAGPLAAARSLRGQGSADADAEGQLRVAAAAARVGGARPQQRHFPPQHHRVKLVDIRRSDDPANFAEDEELVVGIAEMQQRRHQVLHQNTPVQISDDYVNIQIYSCD